MSTPFFPPPRPKASGYRAPAPADLAAADPPAARPIVHRPDAPDPPKPAAKVPVATLELAVRERTYWERHQFFARHPRLVGGLASALGGFLTWSIVDTILHGGRYPELAPVLGPVALCVGLFALAFGYPLDDLGRVPVWYARGLVVSITLGFLVGGVFFLLLG